MPDWPVLAAEAERAAAALAADRHPGQTSEPAELRGDRHPDSAAAAAPSAPGDYGDAYPGSFRVYEEGDHGIRVPFRKLVGTYYAAGIVGPQYFGIAAAAGNQHGFECRDPVERRLSQAFPRPSPLVTGRLGFLHWRLWFLGGGGGRHERTG